MQSLKQLGSVVFKSGALASKSLTTVVHRSILDMKFAPPEMLQKQPEKRSKIARDVFYACDFGGMDEFGAAMGRRRGS